jgi:hypothetical protein
MGRAHFTAAWHQDLTHLQAVTDYVDMAAKVTVERWIKEAGAGVTKLAEYVAAADKQGLQGDPFRNGVGQMLTRWKKEATVGPPLPFGPTAVGSSK